MFNDLLIELDKIKVVSFAYADDLAMVGICKTRLLEALKVVEA